MEVLILDLEHLFSFAQTIKFQSHFAVLNANLLKQETFPDQLHLRKKKEKKKKKRNRKNKYKIIKIIKS